MNIIKKYKILPKTVKATFWFTFCNIILKGISFISVPLFTRILSTDEYGKMSVFYSFEQILLIFSTYEMYNGAYQRGILEFPNDHKGFLNAITILSTALTFISFFIVWIFSAFFCSITQMPFIVLCFMFVYFLFQHAYNCWLTRERFKYNYVPVTIYTILYAVCTTFFSLIAVKYISQTAVTKIIISYAVAIILCFPFYIKSINIKNTFENNILTKKYINYALTFQLPLVLHSLSFLILMQADRIMIGKIVSNSKAAIYSVAYSMAITVSLIQTSVNQVYKPYRYQKLEKKEYNDIRKSTNSLILLMMAAIVLFILIAPDVFRFMFTEEYYEALTLIPPISSSIFFMFLYTIFTDIESYYHETKYIAYVSVVCAILNLILNFIGIHLFGYRACAYTTLICYILFGLLHFLFMCKVCRKYNVAINEMMDFKCIILVSSSLLCIMTLSILLYSIQIIRYISIGIILCFAFLYRKNLLGILRR